MNFFPIWFTTYLEIWGVCLYKKEFTDSDSHSDNFIDPQKDTSFAAYPVHTYNSKTHRQVRYMSEAADQHAWVNTRRQQAAVNKIKHFIIIHIHN